ncbi:MAG: hypothetical protein IKP28_04040 [Clostridia bacterium]|nr:hypothetical protein [Clostridia bacterium]
MAKLTNEEKEKFTDKLNYIGLDIENIPDFLKDFSPLEYRTSKKFDNKEYLVYQYVPINKIKILITPKNRLTDIKEKYEAAKPISEYLKSEDEEGIENFAVFLNMLKNTDIKEIEEVEKKQKELNDSIPFLVRYEKNYLWQIYYSEYSNQYFMLVPSSDMEFGAFFYLLKEQLSKQNKEKYVYVPIANCEPSEEILRRSDISDIENYLWLFTKNWPNVYEITDKDQNKKIVIVGEIEVYSGIKSTYRVELNNKEEASEFYKEIKALFILQAELPSFYKFDNSIDENGNLEFYFKGKPLDYKLLPEFIKNEYSETEKNIKRAKKQSKALTLLLDDLKNEVTEKEKEFLDKQKEITTYLQYKKTFFGRVKYFFSRKKTKKDKQINITATVVDSIEKTDRKHEEKDSYTIEDLIVIYQEYSKILEEKKSKQLDVDALDLKVRNLTKKIENATLYINEIESHKKSIFEFWKFSTKDELPVLNPGEEEEPEEEEKTLRKVFDYADDIEDISMQIDKIQRENLTKEEEDSIFVANSEILDILSKLKTLVKVNDTKIAEVLELLKKKALEQEKNGEITEIDIFGSVSEDRTKIKVLGKNKHRETEKNLFKILGINQDTELVEFKNKLKAIEKNLNKSFENAKCIIDMPIYKVTPIEEKIDLYGYSIYSLDAGRELTNGDSSQNEYNLFKVNLKEEMPAIYYTNIIFFDNFNKTLPLGMDKSTNLIINLDNFDFTLKNRKTFYTNQYFTKETDASFLITKKVNIYEYDISLKKKGAEK